MNLAFNLGLPVHYVDWCDAVAYCRWANKELRPGQRRDPPAGMSADTEKSAWYNACSAQEKAYPYGVGFDNTRCNTDGVGATGVVQAAIPRTSGFGFTENQDGNIYDVVDLRRDRHHLGGVPPVVPGWLHGRLPDERQRRRVGGLLRRRGRRLELPGARRLVRRLLGQPDVRGDTRRRPHAGRSR